MKFMNMPNFLIIGAAKSGTTSLYYYLKKHPQVYMSPVKEPRFFSFENQVLSFKDSQGDNEKANETSITRLEDYLSLFNGVSHQKAIGEASPVYMYYPETYKRIKERIPDVKLIAILRDPVDRAYSSYLHLKRLGLEPCTSFEKALCKEKMRIKENWGLLYHYIEQGFYYKQLKPYYDEFHENQIKVYLFEDLRDRPRDLLRDIYSFLDIDDGYLPKEFEEYNASGIPRSMALYRFLNTKSVFKDFFKPIFPEKIRKPVVKMITKKLLAKPGLTTNSRKLLQQKFADDTLSLQKLIGRDLSNWLV